MKKFIFIILIIIIVLIGFFIYKSNKTEYPNYSSNYTAEKTSTSTNNINTTNSDNNTTNTNSIETEKNENTQKSSDDNETISKFSTKLPKDTKARYSNIDLACDTLNNTVVKSGETFSLWNTLGCPTEEKGYRKAKAFTSGGKIKYSYGGGICQVSTTIYNALLKIDGLKIIERHEHSRDVVYIKDGKDAAVSYKSADLKFKNNLDYDIKLKANVENNKVVIEIEKL